MVQVEFKPTIFLGFFAIKLALETIFNLVVVVIVLSTWISFHGANQMQVSIVLAPPPPTHPFSRHPLPHSCR
jgi:hypothetical protein